MLVTSSYVLLQRFCYEDIAIIIIMSDVHVKNIGHPSSVKS